MKNKFERAFDRLLEDHYHGLPKNRTPQDHDNDVALVRSILTALSSVDFAALEESISILGWKGGGLYPWDGTNINHLIRVIEAASLVLSLGKSQKIDPLSGTPDGLVSE